MKVEQISRSRLRISEAVKWREVWAGKELKGGRIVIVAVITNVYLDIGIPYIQLLKFQLISVLSRIKLFG